MKKISYWLILIAILGALVLSITSCDLAGLSIDSRVDSFIYDLNYDRDNVYTNFHPTETSDYGSLKNVALTIDPVFPPGGIPFTRGALATSDPDNVTAILADNGTQWISTKNARFIMIKDGTTWYIHELYLDGSPVYQ
jgi:hypothetical protein